MAKRSRQHDRDEGLVEMVMSLSWERPLVGLVASGVLLFIAAVAFVLPFEAALIRGVSQLFGALIGMLAIFGLVVGFAAIARDRFGFGSSLPSSGAVTIDSLRAMHWRAFEQFVADVYRRQGYRVREVGGSGDGGVDLIAVRPGGVEHLIQCKAYKAWDVGEPKVREFYGSMAAHRTRCEGILVTCGRFTGPAVEFAAGKPLRLIDGDGLVRMANESNPIAPAVATFSDAAEPPAASPSVAVPPPAVSAAPQQITPPCPRCGSSMVIRTARRGARTGASFWGCKRFPRCSGTIDL